MSTESTPGPWFAVANPYFWEIRTSPDQFSADQIGDACASVHINKKDGAGPDDVAQSEANARLMAAAPELRAALVNAYARLSGAGMLGGDDDPVVRALAIKVTGGAE